jgi:hypothetical protein
VRRATGTLTRMTKIDPTLAQIAAQFTQFDVEQSRGTLQENDGDILRS